MDGSFGAGRVEFRSFDASDSESPVIPTWTAS